MDTCGMPEPKPPSLLHSAESFMAMNLPAVKGKREWRSKQCHITHLGDRLLAQGMMRRATP